MKEKDWTEMKIEKAWIVALGCSFMIFAGIGLASNCFSVFLDPLGEKINITRTATSSLIGVTNFFTAVSIFSCNFLYTKFTIRKCTFVAGLFIASGHGLLVIANTYYLALLSVILIGLGIGAFSYTATSTLIARWFIDKRGFAMGITAAASGIATFLLPPILTLIMNSWGLEAGLLTQCLLILTLVILTTSLIVNHPEDAGVKPYKIMKSSNNMLHEQENCSKSMSVEGNALEKEGVSEAVFYRILIKNKNFIVILFTSFMLGLTLAPTFQHVAPIITSLGFEKIFASMMVSIFGVCMIISKILAGTVIDKKGTLFGTILIGVFWILAMIVPVFINTNATIAIIFACLVGFGAPFGSVFIPLWSLDLLPMSLYLKTISICQGVLILGGAVGGVLPGIVYDTTGSYIPTFYFFAGFTLIALFMIIKSYYKRNNLNEN